MSSTITIRLSLSLILLSLLSACGRDETVSPPPAAAADNTVIAVTPVDLVLTNGKVLTVDAGFSIHDTVVVNDGLILATGDRVLATRYRGQQTIDLEGKLLMPGFNDSHTHIRGRPRRHVELTDATSIDEIQRLVRSRIDEIGEGEWITGYGWSEDQLDEGRRPLRTDLDAVALNNPVLLTRAGGHSAVANSMALELAGVTLATPQPEGGVIERGDDGELNGIIRERQEIVSRLVPAATYEEIIASLERNLNALLARGITSITDASKTVSDYAMFEDLYANNQLPLPRASLQFQWHDPAAIDALHERVAGGNAMLKPGPIKVFADGDLPALRPIHWNPI